MNEVMTMEPATALSVANVRAQVQAIQSVMRELMHENEHFGKIPGTNKFSLYKSGAEKLGLMFRLIPRFDVQRHDLSSGHREYEIVCNLENNGRVIGQGVGSCSTMEGKYRYRHEGGFEVQDEPIPQDYKERKEQYRRQGFGAKQIDGRWVWVRFVKSEKIENPDIADTYNTVLKMAKKRAYIDAVITATAASDIFTQDIEPEDDDAPAATPEPPKPKTDPLKDLKATALQLCDEMLDGQLMSENQWKTAQENIGRATSQKALEAMINNYQRQLGAPQPQNEEGLY